MDTLPEAFGMLRLLGLWKSDKWIITVIGKMMNVLGQRHQIIELMRSLEVIQFQPKNEKEHQLKEQCIKSIRFYTHAYIAFVGILAIVHNSLVMLECYKKGSLPYKVWFPYNVSNIYLFTSFQQVITIIFVAHINVTYDTLLLGILFHICLQVNILKHRFHGMLNDLQGILSLKGDMNSEEYRTLEKTLITEYVMYQNAIFKLVENLTDIFSLTMFLQFGLSALILCTSIYALAQTSIFSPEFIGCTVYIVCMISHIFLPCLIGNQMTLEFSELNDAIYSTNWYTLSNNFRKCMNLIMIRSSKPVTFSSGYVISLSLGAFKSLIKLSYSIYNVFQQSS
ncbi:odorant receptor Or1-like [Chelonus insularis]|uniref:odorant receptor Or1-like n=1 Tax=Chelonus insularis TaxID=460826 RepID=UPI00158F1A5D|nr:odorant receptor Or1-like [Chelonus insularis]